MPPQQCIRITDQCHSRFVSKSGGVYGVGSIDKIPTAFAATNVTATVRIMAIAMIKTCSTDPTAVIVSQKAIPWRKVRI